MVKFRLRAREEEKLELLQELGEAEAGLSAAQVFNNRGAMPVKRVRWV